MKSLLSLVCAAVLFALAGCNTVKGFGQDVQKVGEKLENAAEKK